MEKKAGADRIIQAAGEVIEQRARHYGHDPGAPSPSFARIAKLWSVVLGVKITPRKVALCMIALKLSREIGSHDDDNLVDLAAYAALIAELEAETE